MRSVERAYLKSYIEDLSEDDLWDDLINYFYGCRGLETHTMHAAGEHGMDLVVKVDPETDVLGVGYIIVVQAKTGRLTLGGWRKVLRQLLEAPYYRIPYSRYAPSLARRLLLVVSGLVTEHARNGIDEFNNKHDFKVELWEIDELIEEYDRHGYADQKLEQITKVGSPEALAEPGPFLGETPDQGEKPTTSDVLGEQPPNS
jgi:hypothetical protein